MNKITKGQKIWIWVNRQHGDKVIETTVKSAGAKYITTHYGIKYDAKTLKEVDSRGIPSYIILDLEEHNKKQDYRMKLDKLKNIKWECLEEDDFNKVYDIVKDYD